MQTQAARSGAAVARVRRLYENVVPNTMACRVEPPEEHICKFVPSGEYLVCFGNMQHDLVVYRYTGWDAACPGERSEPPECLTFNRFFQLAYRSTLAHGAEALCKDFCLAAHGEKYLIVASSTAAAPGSTTAAEAADARVPGTPLVASTTIHLVRLADGQQLDQYTITDDFVHLAHNSGVYLYEDLLAVLAMRSQEVHLLQVLERGRLVWVQRLGRHCWDDDAMLLANQAEAERRWQREQEAAGHVGIVACERGSDAGPSHVRPHHESNRQDVENRRARSDLDQRVPRAEAPHAPASPAPASREQLRLDAPRAAPARTTLALAGPPRLAPAPTLQLPDLLPGGDLSAVGQPAAEPAAEEGGAAAGAGGARGGEGGPSGRGLIEGLTHRILAYLYLERSRGGPRSDELRRFYYYFEKYAGLAVWKVQFLDRDHLLFSVGPGDAALLRSSDVSSQAYFLAVYARGAGRVVDLHDNRSGALLALYLRWPQLFYAACVQSPWAAFATPLPAAVAARAHAERQPSPLWSQPQMVKRLLAGVPTTAQALCASPYLDANLFAFDDKLISAVQRPRPYAEQLLKFVSRAHPERSRFKVQPFFVEAANGRPGSKQVVAYHFHPVLPFVLCLLHTQQQPLQVCIALRT
ncbi:hypothetical protein WJX81_002105 [Elliptochloris bilobata]|uniref:Light-mediated development protein DET1 n=1 Tax=Elliptochloris bilobata TaxID=381761 RepID=A0AAW1SIW9_9CHLO